MNLSDVANLDGSLMPDDAGEMRSPEETPKENTGPFEYSHDAPIKEVDREQLAHVAQSFSDAIGSYATDHTGKPVSALQPNDTDLAKRWINRSQDAQDIAEDVRLPDPLNGKIYAYDLGDEHTVGLMTLDNSPPVTEVAYLVTHPGTSGVGKTMIEKAVNESEAKGHSGKVRLMASDTAVEGFYASVDFKKQGVYMTLNPSESDLWTRSKGTWRLKEHQDSGYLKKVEW